VIAFEKLEGNASEGIEEEPGPQVLHGYNLRACLQVLVLIRVGRHEVDEEVQDKQHVDDVLQDIEPVGVFVDERGAVRQEGCRVRQEQDHDYVPHIFEGGLGQNDEERWGSLFLEFEVELDGGSKQVDSLLQVTEPLDHEHSSSNLGDSSLPQVICSLALL